MLGASGNHVANVASTSGRGRPAPALPMRGQRALRLAVSATLVGPDPRLATPRPSNPSSRLILPNTTTEPGQLVFSPNAEEVAMRRCMRLHEQYPNGVQMPRLKWDGAQLDLAYARCGTVTSEYAKTFYLGTQLMTPKQAKAIWAIYVWCRRTDELVDGPNADRITPKALDRWEERLEALFEGRPYDVLDAALTDTISQFAVDIQPFRDMIEGMRMDLVKTRYATFEELYDYCYRVAGAVALMTMPVMGINPQHKGPMERVYRAALALGTANQLTNILRDVGEDANERNRIYIPQEDLERFGISEREVLSSFHAPSEGRSSEKWREMMKFQIARARDYFVEAESGVDLLDQNARWPVWSALVLYRQILQAVETNDYDNFTRRAYVPKWRKLASLPLALGRSLLPVKGL